MKLKLLKFLWELIIPRTIILHIKLPHGSSQEYNKRNLESIKGIQEVYIIEDSERFDLIAFAEWTEHNVNKNTRKVHAKLPDYTLIDVIRLIE